MNTKENKTQIKFFKLINDDVFWMKFSRTCLSRYRVDLFSNYKTTYRLPGKKTLESFVEEDYKFITGDERDTREIVLELLSIENEK